jgi:hypothetical protein
MLNALVGNLPLLKFSLHQCFVLSADVAQSIPYQLADVFTVIISQLTQQLDSGTWMITKKRLTCPNSQTFRYGSPDVWVWVDQPVFDHRKRTFISHVGTKSIEGLRQHLLHAPMSVLAHPTSQNVQALIRPRGKPAQD